MIFDHPDEIGSATTATDCTGNLVNEKLYYPFGELWTGYAIPNLGLHQEFAQLPDYDPETDQYNTANRHYSPSGRWISPDPFANDTHTSDPQSWNLYAYGRNNPLRLVDPTGEIVENTDDKKHKLSKGQMKAIAKDLQTKTGLKSMNFDKNGQLGYDKNETASGGSAGLRDQITSAINSQTDVFKLGDYSGSTDLNFMDTDAGTVSKGVTTYNTRIDFDDYQSAADLSDPQAMAAFSLGLGISHEIAHEFPSFNPNDTGPGGVIDFVNTFQRQLGLPTRDTNIHSITCLSGTCSIPFHDLNGQQHLLKWQLENSRH
jgi:RHS repeat-associated protein